MLGFMGLVLVLLLCGGVVPAAAVYGGKHATTTTHTPWGAGQAAGQAAEQAAGQAVGQEPHAHHDGQEVDEMEVDRRDFHAFMVRYSRTYSSVDSMEHAFQVFRRNKQRITRLNTKQGQTIYGINQFTDVDPVEFRKIYTGFGPDPAHASIRRNMPVLDVPINSMLANVTSWDWRDHGAITPVRNQGACGACWAISVVETAAAAWFFKGHPLPILSPQQLLDCDYLDDSCTGGDPIKAYRYLSQIRGLESEKSYPFTGVNESTCVYNASLAVATVSNFTYLTPPCIYNATCPNQDEHTLAANLVSVGPASICVNTDDGGAWQHYIGGIMTSSTPCDNGYFSLDHCAQLVGFNTDTKTGTKYWVVKNSWGPSWGEGGYIFLEFGTNLCGLADEATFVIP